MSFYRAITVELFYFYIVHPPEKWATLFGWVDYMSICAARPYVFAFIARSFAISKAPLILSDVFAQSRRITILLSFTFANPR